MTKEYWKPIEGYEGLYEVSNIGRVKNLGKYYKETFHGGHEKIMYSEPRISSLHYDLDGYLKVALTKDGKCTTAFVHRLVAKAFIYNEDPTKNVVNHKNGVKDDNRVENLEWCTPKYNTQHAHDTGLCGRCPRSQYVAKLNDNNEVIGIYRTVMDATLSMGRNFRNSNIALVCRRNYGRAYGFKWKYITVDEYAYCLLEFKKGNKTVSLQRDFGSEEIVRHTSINGGVPVAQMDDNNNIIAVYRNSRKASFAIGKKGDNGRTIRRVCSGQLEHHAGYRWKWISIEEYESIISQSIT